MKLPPWVQQRFLPADLRAGPMSERGTLMFIATATRPDAVLALLYIELAGTKRARLIHRIYNRYARLRKDSEINSLAEFLPRASIVKARDGLRIAAGRDF